MSRSFEELARSTTPMGDIVLRRRLEPTLQIDIFEVMLGGDGLMSSLFTDGEEALARLGLSAATGDALDVAVGGLGLGYTARTVLQDSRVRSLHVIDTLAVVIDWHRRHLVPLGAELTDDPRCELVHGDFFALVDAKTLLPGEAPSRLDVILVDIDHSPKDLLHPHHAVLYERAGLRQLATHLHPGGVFALWSNDPPDEDFLDDLRHEFASAEAEVVTFPNFLIDGHSSSTIYVATTARQTTYDRLVATATPTSTPNPDATKFNLDTTLPAMFNATDAAQAAAIPFAADVFAAGGVASVFGVNDFVTVTRQPGADWEPIIAAVQAAAAAHL